MKRKALTVGILAGAILAMLAFAAPADAAKSRRHARKPVPKAAPVVPAPAPPIAPAPPAAPPGEPAMFTVFRTVCADHQGEIADAEAEARKQGFETVPPPPDADPDEVARHTVLKRESADLSILVILTRAPDDVLSGVPNGEATLCVVSGPDPGGLVATAAKGWVGLESNSQDGNHITYLYRQGAAQRQLLVDQSEPTIQSAIIAGEFRVFDIDPEGLSVTLGLMTGRTRPPKR